MIAFCPPTPLLVDTDAWGDVPEVQSMRAAARAALGDLIARQPARVVVLGSEPTHNATGGTLRGYGIAVDVGDPAEGLGLAHVVGGWLLDDAGWSGPRVYVDDLSEVTTGDAVLVMADGTATRTEKAPGFIDDRAEAFDGVIKEALREGDAALLAGMDLTLAEDLWCRAGHAWRTAGDAVSARLGMSKGTSVVAQMRYDGAPLGVGWFVADWTVESSDS